MHRSWLTWVAVGIALVLSAVAVLDPLRSWAAIPGAVLALGAWVMARPRSQTLTLAALLGMAWAACAIVSPEFRADSFSYFVYLRSVAFDRDLDFTNEWAHRGLPPPPLTPTAHRQSVHSIGAAILWSPFYLLAHVYAALDLASGSGLYPADGYSVPYERACALGTVAGALSGSWLLFGALVRAHGQGVALVSVCAAVAAAPVLYYVFVVPAMAHGLCYAAVAALLWAWDQARRQPSERAWILVGALLGLATLIRWQAAVCLLLVLALAVDGLVRKTVRPRWLVAGAASGLLVFSPQLVAWWILFGRLWTIPQGEGFMDWRSPHLADALLSADHGFLSWTPAMILGVVGLIVGFRRDRLLHGAALLVFLATAWVNGGVWDWQAGDAFGGRRFDLVVPFMAQGLAVLAAAAIRLQARAPLVLPAAAAVAMGLWNVGFIALFREGRYPAMAPLERLAGDQGRNVRRAFEAVLGGLGGPRARALAYKYFSGQYFYTTFNTSGGIDLWAADERYLLSGWGTHSRRALEPSFRWALHPEACVRLPLEAPFELPVTIAAWAPESAQPQVMSIVVNGRLLGASNLGTEWTDVRIRVPARDLVPGENALCLRFSNFAAAEKGPRVAACVSHIQLP